MPQLPGCSSQYGEEIESYLAIYAQGLIKASIMTLPESLRCYINATLDEYRQQQRYRHLVDSVSDGVHITQENKRYLSFCSNDYLGIGAALAKRSYKAASGAGASRLITGNHPLYTEVESQLARMKQIQKALLFGSGYLANIGTIPALVSKSDLVLMDKASHACMTDGVRLSGAIWKRFRHNDMEHLDALLSKYRADYHHCLILTETIFSMDGDAAPLDVLADLAHRYDSWLMTDDAHGLGILQTSNPAHIQMGTLSKAAGCYGGYVCGDIALIDLLVNKAFPLIFSTALPPIMLHAIQDALTMMEQEKWRREKVMCHAKNLCKRLRLDEPVSPIIPLIIGDNERVIEYQAKLKEQGILVSAIRPPTVPAGTARLRLSLSAAHSDDDIERLAEVVAALQ